LGDALKGHDLRACKKLPDAAQISCFVTGYDFSRAANAAKFMRVAEQRRAQLLWYAQRITNNREEAEDIVQEALLNGFRNLPQFRGESQMGTWLCVIVQNTAVEWLRKQRGQAYLSLEYVRNRDNEPQMLDFPDPSRNPEQFFEYTERARILLSEIDELNSVCKSAIQMCALEEFSHREAANTLGVNAFTMKPRIFMENEC